MKSPITVGIILLMIPAVVSGGSLDEYDPV